MRLKFEHIKKFPQCHYHINIPITNLKRGLEDLEGERGLILNPTFQRGHVWTIKQKVDYIVYLLMGGVSGRDIYFNNPSWFTSWHLPTVCVDGLQRITAILEFLDNKFPIEFKDTYGNILKGYYRDSEDDISITNHLNVHMGNLEKESDVVEWYINFNSGGTPHRQEEIDRVKAYHKKLLKKGK
jgi:hypothetical protein